MAAEAEERGVIARRVVGKRPASATASDVAGEDARREAEREFALDWAPTQLSASSADYYFNSYNHYGVHEDVLKDGVTIASYRNAILQNSHLFRGKVVIDVCAGLGICGLFAAQAGARKVVAIEAQPELVSMGTKIASRNGFGPDVFHFVCGKAADLAELPGEAEQADVLVSEWMGYFLMYESRLEDVLYARDKFLKKGGLMFPDRAKLHVALLEDSVYTERHFEFYRNVWGFNFSPMKVPSYREPVVNSFEETQLLSTSACVLDLDLYHCSSKDCFGMASTFQINCRRTGSAHALLFWFEICFDACHKQVMFDTGPSSVPTCWKQTALFFSGEAPLVHGGDRVRGMVAVRKNVQERRDLDIKVCAMIRGSVRTHLYHWS